MKKKLLIIAIVAFLGVAIMGGHAVLNSIFPKADPINAPIMDNIISISLTQNNDTAVVVEETDFEELLQNISNARPTRKMSVNDYPIVKTYYTIEVATSTREYRYFIYEENSQVYIEVPYEGIYKSKQQMLNIVLEHYQE